MKKYRVLDEQFATKEELRLRVRSIMDKYKPGQSLEPYDFRFMRDLLNSHSEADEKIGCGVRSIEVELEPIWKSKALYLTRVDGSRTDFSFRNCIGVAPEDTPYNLFKDACRESVSNIVLDFKIKYFEGRNTAPCSVTGEQLKFSQTHVDHSPPFTFIELVDSFIRVNQIDLKTIKYTGFEDGQVRRLFADEKLSQKFIDYHNKRAKLRVVSGKWNVRNQ